MAEAAVNASVDKQPRPFLDPNKRRSDAFLLAQQRILLWSLIFCLHLTAENE